MNPEDLAIAYLRSIDTHRDTEWFEAPCANPIDVAGAEIEPWFHDMFEHLKKATGAITVRSNGYTFDMSDLKAIQVFSMGGCDDAVVLTTKLSLVRLNVGFFVFVSGAGDVRQDEISVWSAAIVSANAKLGQAHPEHAWWAVLGPDSRRHGMMRPFVGDADLGRVSVRAGDFGYRETVPVSLRAASTFMTGFR